MFVAEVRKGYSGIAPFDDQGNPVAGRRPILEMIRDAEATLGTGHLARGRTCRVRRCGQRSALHAA